MFYCFVVREDHRDYLRYFWYEDNDVNKNMVEYQMKVHVFGNSPSPAVAIYCMSEWDAPLLPEKEKEWNLWKDSLKALEDLQIQRSYIPVSLSSTQRRELCIFSDASTVAIGAVAYLRAVDTEGQYYVGFVLGKSKLAPRPAHTIPCLKLCAAVLAVELFELIRDEIDIDVDAVKFFTNNLNPADHATRSILAAHLGHSSWFSGPAFLFRANAEEPESNPFTLVEPETDAEIRPDVKTLVTKASKSQLGSQHFERFSSWKTLYRTTARLIYVAASFHESTENAEHKGWKCFKEAFSTSELSQSKAVIIRSVLHNVFKEEFKCLEEGQTFPKQIPLKKLNEDGLLWVGVRMSSADLLREEKHPLIIPHTRHIATLLVRYYHKQVAHQGRHITEGAVRAAGYWIIGSKRFFIHKCVICRKLRGRLEDQKMADLPADRLTPEPPFTSVGLDVFGPWTIMTRRTREGSADSKRWAVLFTCMSTRAVHIELI
ncbi:hypothetical protein SKAU_G00193240 [Synaphobranchus kaupii]|uniref:Integrase zinc-binding domain-containing protein n=1 Tax=Synaphobranchus kaupii TaxID=118154 RepID=A0A9Q1IXL9_SYNKA|nr:hypothetical protein SKAU_G00193240 [Synaphobranchus kaupii]